MQPIHFCTRGVCCGDTQGCLQSAVQGREKGRRGTVRCIKKKHLLAKAISTRLMSKDLPQQGQQIAVQDADQAELVQYMLKRKRENTKDVGGGNIVSVVLVILFIHAIAHATYTSAVQVLWPRVF